MDIKLLQIIVFSVCSGKYCSRAEFRGMVPHLKIPEVVLVHCNTANNDYQHDSADSYTFVPKKSFGQLLDISQARKKIKTHKAYKKYRHVRHKICRHLRHVKRNVGHVKKESTYVTLFT